MHVLCAVHWHKSTPGAAIGDYAGKYWARCAVHVSGYRQYDPYQDCPFESGSDCGKVRNADDG
ncbi:hypothetical protein CBM2587_A160422 [Cupriavidus taiwanensis]|uniref:Uncharacterized protein n=1 Tax=Cupriavidus taiwanensis TaxID=164546 RepID=A0A375BJN0_9BURK|nr:hypothetical protein CBM2587_A160422 [Cupriavidus taiwanensis]